MGKSDGESLFFCGKNQAEWKNNENIVWFS